MSEFYSMNVPEKATTFVQEWLEGLISYDEMMGQLCELAVTTYVGQLLKIGIDGCMADVRAEYVRAIDDIRRGGDAE